MPIIRTVKDKTIHIQYLIIDSGATYDCPCRGVDYLGQSSLYLLTGHLVYAG